MFASSSESFKQIWPKLPLVVTILTLFAACSSRTPANFGDLDSTRTLASNNPKPECLDAGKATEGWQAPGGKRIKEKCSARFIGCRAIGSKSEGWWSFGLDDRALVGFAKCSSDEARQPKCVNPGTPNEGWLLENGQVRRASCVNKTIICSAVGSRSEGWYAGTAIDSKLIGWDSSCHESVHRVEENVAHDDSAPAQHDSLSPEGTSMKLPKNARGLYAVQATLLTAGFYVPKCPRGAMCEPSGIATFAFTLNGCLDKMGPVSVNVLPGDEAGHYKLDVTAYAIELPGSDLARCMAPNVQQVTVFLPVLGGLTKDRIDSVYSNSRFHYLSN